MNCSDGNGSDKGTGQKEWTVNSFCDNLFTVSGEVNQAVKQKKVCGL